MLLVLAGSLALFGLFACVMRVRLVYRRMVRGEPAPPGMDVDPLSAAAIGLNLAAALSLYPLLAWRWAAGDLSHGQTICALASLLAFMMAGALLLRRWLRAKGQERVTPREGG